MGTALSVYSQGIPRRVFTGRLLAGGKWHRIEIDCADGLQIPMEGGRAYGIGCPVRLADVVPPRGFWVVVDVTRLTGGDPSDRDKVKVWLPKCGVMLAVAALSGNKAIPDSGIFFVDAPDYARDPQREDAHAFRRRCRFDVLTVVTFCLNANPPEAFCKYSTLEAAETHTRIYARDDFVDAIQLWQQKGYLRLLNRAGDIQIKQTHDDDMMAELSTYSWEEATTPATGTSPTRPVSVTAPTEYDVFIAHASEDKAAVVVPLTEELKKRGLRPWVDYKELLLGDKLRQRIDDGLSRSRFGIVIASPSFFGKQWPQSELDGLVALEMADGRKRILPVWHDVDYEGVAKHSPMLAGRLAVKWIEGLAKVAGDIVRAVRG